MYVNKCTKCGKEFETKNPKRVICPDCLYPDKTMIIQSDVSEPTEAKPEQPLQSYSTPEAPRNYPPRNDYNRGGAGRPQGGYQQREGGYNRPQGGYQNRDGGGYNRPQGGYQQREGGYQQREGGYNRPPQQGGYQNGGGYNRPQGGYQQREGGYNRPPQQGGYQNRDGGGYNRPQGGYQQREGGYQQREGGYNRPQQGGYNNRPAPGGRPRFNQGGGRPMPRNNKPLLVDREQLEKIEALYKTMLPLPNPDAHEVIGAHIDLEPRKVFFGINLIRQKLMLPKLPFPKRKLAISPDQLFAIKNLYEPLLPVPPIGCHKIIAAQLRMDEWRVHVGIGLVRAEMGLDRWNPDRADAPAEFKAKLEEEKKAAKKAKKEENLDKEPKAKKEAKAPKEAKEKKVSKKDAEEKPVKKAATKKSEKTDEEAKVKKPAKAVKADKEAKAEKVKKTPAKTTKKAKDE